MITRLDEVGRAGAQNYSKIHFVTYSLGGVIARRYLAEYAHEKCSRVLMIAPSLRSSYIIDWLSESLLRKVLDNFCRRRAW